MQESIPLSVYKNNIGDSMQSFNSSIDTTHTPPPPIILQYRFEYTETIRE